MDLYPKANIQKIHKNSLNRYNFIANCPFLKMVDSVWYVY